MKRFVMILSLSIIIFLFVGCGVLQEGGVNLGGDKIDGDLVFNFNDSGEKTTVTNVTKQNVSSPPAFIFTEKNGWIPLKEDKTMESGHYRPFVQRYVGHGRSYLIRFTEGGLLREEWKGRGDKGWHRRQRVIEAGDPVRVICAAAIIFNGVVLISADKFLGGINDRELRDREEWKPDKIHRVFNSVESLRRYAKAKGLWVVISGYKSGPLVGYMHPGVPVSLLKAEGRTFFVFEFDTFYCHFKYRYLEIYEMGGHDVHSGSGIVSVFGFSRGSDGKNLRDVCMVTLHPGGLTTYFKEPMPGHRLKYIF